MPLINKNSKRLNLILSPFFIINNLTYIIKKEGVNLEGQRQNFQDQTARDHQWLLQLL